VKTGAFRNDPYFTFHLPPLSQRINDTPLLSYFFLKKHAVTMKKSVTELSVDVMALLMHYEFPDNIRELENIVSRSVALTQGSRIEIGHLPEDLKLFNVKIFRKKGGNFPSLEEQELDYIKWVLDAVAATKRWLLRLSG